MGRDTSACSDRKSRPPVGTAANQMGVQKQNYDGDIIVKVSPDASIDLFQVRVSHFPFLRCFP